MSSRRRFFDEVPGVIGRLVVLAAGSLAAMFVFGIALKPLLPYGLPMGRDGQLIFTIVLACALGVGHLIAAVAVERGRWETTGIGPGAWRPLALLTGPMLGVLSVAAPAVTLLVFGSAEIVSAPGTGWYAFAADSIMVAALFALVAELAYRGYAIGLIAERWGNVAAVVITTLAAALVHLFDPQVTALSLAGGAALSCCLGAIRLRTGSLATAWLAHLGFAATQRALLHAPLGGADLPAPPGYAFVPGQPTWLTGGTLGLGAGAAVTASLAVITFLVFRPRRANARPARA